MIQDKTLDKIIDVIVEAVDPDKIILFGSRATGNYREDSDYDIFVLKSGINNERTFTYTINKALFNKKVFEAIDLIASNPEKFDKNKNDPFMVYKDIYEQGITIYE